MANLKKKKLGERIGGGLIQLKGNDEHAQVFSIVSDDIFSYVYHFDDVYNTLGKFLCLSEYDEDGKMTKKCDCCKLFKKKTERIVIPVWSYDGRKKNYKKIAEGKFKYLKTSTIIIFMIIVIKENTPKKIANPFVFFVTVVCLLLFLL